MKCKTLFALFFLAIFMAVGFSFAGESDNWKVKHPDWIWCDDFDSDRSASYFEYNMAGGKVARTAGCGIDGSSAMKTTFSTGDVDVGWMKVAFGRTPSAYFRPVDAGTTNYREIYWRIYVKFQPGWVGGGAVKMSRATVMATSGWAQAAFAHVWSAGNTDPKLYIDPARGTDAAGNLKTTKYNDFANMYWFGAIGSITPIFNSAHVGEWHCFETRMKLNDPGQANGIQQLWIDGNLEATSSGLNWVGMYTNYGINMVFLENYWNSGSIATQDRYMDNFVISTKPIGMIVTKTDLILLGAPGNMKIRSR